MKIQEQIREIIEKSKGKKLYIYGVGIWGKRIYCLLQSEGKKIDGWIDARGGYAQGYEVYFSSEIKKWKKGSYFIVVSSGQSGIIREVKERLLNCGLSEEADFTVFNKFVENREGINDIKDYLFGYSRNYGQKVNGFKIFTHSRNAGTVKRIVVLGGSTSDCGYNTTIRNWTEWLEMILYDKGYSVEIWAGGIQGYASSQELMKLIRDVLVLKPDLVISFSGINDATGLGIMDGCPLMMQSVKYLLKDESTTIEYGLRNDEDPASIWFMNMKMMQSICKVSNISFLGILEPFPFYDRRKNQDKFARVFFEENVQQRIFKFYDNVKEQIVNEEYLIDLSSLFIDKPEMIYDYIHCDTKGNRLIAESIEKHIIMYL